MSRKLLLPLFCFAFLTLLLMERSAADPAQGQLPLIAVDFYGYGGIDLDKVRAVLPVHAGDEFASAQQLAAMAPKIRAAILETIGKPPAYIGTVQIEHGYLIYVGLPGNTMKDIKLNPTPTGSEKLPPAVSSLYEQTMEIWTKSVAAGALEDDSQGYAISSYPELKAKQLAMRELALHYEAEIRDVLKNSADEKQRVAASDALGYAQQNAEQIAALVQACHDTNDEVRNNATRALGVLASSNPKTAEQIPPHPFIELLASASWTDRNKGGWVLQKITETRNPKTLAALRQQALEPLIEMARWHEAGHAISYRMLLGRIAGIEEKKLNSMVDKSDQVEAIIAAVRSAPEKH